ncbi:hypothetical protein V6N11_033951 [Hibiscus sabdariffa]|uniref:Uncharacterized protein n=1 Tax=Hibiscus sabdariffa TaxID=183260 RepID=A0ABR2S1N3_9ROSI
MKPTEEGRKNSKKSREKLTDRSERSVSSDKNLTIDSLKLIVIQGVHTKIVALYQFANDIPLMTASRRACYCLKEGNSFLNWRSCRSSLTSHTRLSTGYHYTTRGQ